MESKHQFSLETNEIQRRFSYVELHQVLKIQRGGEELEFFEDPRKYSYEEKETVVNMIKSSNKTYKLLSKASALLGFVRFTKGWYVLVATDVSEVAEIGNNKVFEVKKTDIFPLFIQAVFKERKKKKKAKINLSFKKVKQFFSDKEANKREKKYLSLFTGSIDLSNNFYLSYSYDLLNTLQHNMTKGKETEEEPCYDNRFVWNSHFLKPAASMKNKRWLVPLIHGYVGQVRCSFYGRCVNIVIIGRRSKFFAGRRYLKRGICSTGHVANFVETEQIMFDVSSLSGKQERGSMSSYVQIRGSVPLYWSQEISKKMVDPKPDIKLNRTDADYKATKLHFDWLFSKYGRDLIVFNLLKEKEKKPREFPLSIEFERAMDHVNSVYYRPNSQEILYFGWDIRRLSKESSKKCLNTMSSYSRKFFETTSFFCTKKKSPTTDSDNFSLQSGVVRSNCVDGLDRTNISQLMQGLYVLGHQLQSMGFTKNAHLLDYPELIKSLIFLYQELGDSLALQYGGSPTVSSGLNYRGLTWDVFTSVKRYYSNNFIDQEKQNGMNLFLGVFQPKKQVVGEPKQVDIWDLKWDYYLHENQVTKMEKKEEMIEEEEEKGEEDEKEIEDSLEKNMVELEGIMNECKVIRQGSMFEGYESDIEDDFVIVERMGTRKVEKEEEKDEDLERFVDILNSNVRNAEYGVPFPDEKFVQEERMKKFYENYLLRENVLQPKVDVQSSKSYINFTNFENLRQWHTNDSPYDTYVDANRGPSGDNCYFQFYNRRTILMLKEYFPNLNIFVEINAFIDLVVSARNDMKCSDKLNYSHAKGKRSLCEILSKGEYFDNCFYGFEFDEFLNKYEKLNSFQAVDKENFLKYLLDNRIIIEVKKNDYKTKETKESKENVYRDSFADNMDHFEKFSIFQFCQKKNLAIHMKRDFFLRDYFELSKSFWD